MITYLRAVDQRNSNIYLRFKENPMKTEQIAILKSNVRVRFSKEKSIEYQFYFHTIFLSAVAFKLIRSQSLFFIINLFILYFPNYVSLYKEYSYGTNDNKKNKKKTLSAPPPPYTHTAQRITVRAPGLSA